jgi:molybdate transport system ATP-binding protein
MSDHALELHVGKQLGAFKLEAELKVSGRGVVALFGRSGSGKSCLVNAIAGLMRPDTGRIAVNGETLFDSTRRIDAPVESRRIGYVFQDARLFPHMSVRNNLLYGWKRARGERHIGFDEVVSLLGVEGLLERRPAGLSGGEKQRIAIGRALLAQPRLLLMDEPLASLDSVRKAEILPYIEKLRDELGIMIVYVSHALEEVYRLANTIAVVSEGRVAAQGSPEELSQRLDLWPLMGRFEAGAVLSTHVRAHDDAAQLTFLDFADGSLTVARADLPVGARVRVRVRARDVILAIEEPRGLSVQNTLKGEVAEIAEEEGALAEVKVRIGRTALLARITRDSVRRLQLAPGKPVYALLKSVALEGRSLSVAPEEG